MSTQYFTTSFHIVLAVLTVSNFATLQDLLKDLKYELGGHFEDIVLALMMPPADYDATSLRKAIKVSTRYIEFRQKGGWSCKGGVGGISAMNQILHCENQGPIPLSWLTGQQDSPAWDIGGQQGFLRIQFVQFILHA